MEHTGRARRLLQLEFLQLLAGDGREPAAGSDLGKYVRDRRSTRSVAKEKWICLEVMVKTNDVGDSNGQQAYWLDGKLSRTREGKISSYLGKGFPSVAPGRTTSSNPT